MATRQPPPPESETRGPLAGSIVALAETPEDASTLDAQLKTIAQLAADRIGAVDYASVTALRGNVHTTVAASSELARAVDEAQYTERGGPCVQAVDEAVPVAVPDVSATMSWPGFRRTALELGLNASVSLPLFPSNGATVAVLNLFGRDPVTMAPLIVGVWAVYDPDRPMPTRDDPLPALDAGGEELLSGFAEALAVRATIQLAVDALTGRMNCTADEAYLILRLHAAETGTSLSTAATALITRRSGP
ncbi:MAG TPA: GAF and ANTAR domain-containing protein [Actinoplanes sp.]|jgi:hypothetical protein